LGEVNATVFYMEERVSTTSKKRLPKPTWQNDFLNKHFVYNPRKHVPRKPNKGFPVSDHQVHNKHMRLYTNACQLDRLPKIESGLNSPLVTLAWSPESISNPTQKPLRSCRRTMLECLRSCSPEARLAQLSKRRTSLLRTCRFAFRYYRITKLA